MGERSAHDLSPSAPLPLARRWRSLHRSSASVRFFQTVRVSLPDFPHVAVALVTVCIAQDPERSCYRFIGRNAIRACFPSRVLQSIRPAERIAASMNRSA